jgi:hypothetical protein
MRWMGLRISVASTFDAPIGGGQFGRNVSRPRALTHKLAEVIQAAVDVLEAHLGSVEPLHNRDSQYAQSAIDVVTPIATMRLTDARPPR